MKSTGVTFIAFGLVSLFLADILPAQNFDILRGDESGVSQLTNRLRSQAEAAYKEGKYDRVVEIASQVIQLEPAQPFAYYLRASAQIEKGKATRSAALVRLGIKDARESLRLGGNEYRFLYVPYLYGLSALSEVEGRPQHAEMAIQVASPVLERDDLSVSDRSQIVYQRALCYVATKDYEKAAADYGTAARLSPELVAAFLGEARAYVSLGNEQLASASFDRAVRQFPSLPIVYNERGTFLLRSGDTGAAISDFTRALQNDSKFVMGYTNRGIALSESGQYDAAVTDLAQALQLNPRQVVARRYLAVAMLSRGDLEVARKQLGETLKLSPEYTDAIAERGFAAFYAGDYPSALADFEKALSLDKSLLYLGPWRFAARFKAGEEEAARKELVDFLAAKEGPRELIALISKHLLGEVTEEELLKSTELEDPQATRDRRCDALFFVAFKKGIESPEEAAAVYEKCLETEAFHLASYRGAKYALGKFVKN